MKVRLSVYSLMHHLNDARAFRVYCKLAGVFDHKQVLDLLRSGDFEFVMRSD